jgi:hypothetical protein
VGRTLPLLIAAAAVAAAASCGGGGAPAPPAAAPSDWLRFADDPAEGMASYLRDVWADPTGGAWAVGAMPEPGVDRSLSYALGWDGSEWERTAIPDRRPGGTNTLAGVGGAGRRDVWAVGWSKADAEHVASTVAVHWDGTAWSRVTTPNPGPAGNRLEAVAAVGSDDVWAVGAQLPPASASWQPLAIHWDGASWAGAAFPAVEGCGETGELTDVAAGGGVVLATGTCWAVSPPGAERGFVGSWDGERWEIVHTTGSESESTRLASVAVAGTDAWVVGWSRTIAGAAGGPETALLVHHDGRTWATTAVPTGAASSRLNQVVTHAGQVWAVGVQGDRGRLRGSLGLHWDGRRWTVERLGGGPEADEVADLHGVDVGPSGQLWAVGLVQGDGAAPSALILGRPTPAVSP